MPDSGCGTENTFRLNRELAFTERASPLSPTDHRPLGSHKPLVCSDQSRLLILWPRGIRCPCRQLLDLLARRLVGNGQIELRLQVDPELRVGAEPVTKAQGGVTGDGSFAADDLRDAVCGHVNLTGEFCERDAKLFELVLEDHAGMYCTFEHG